MHNRIIPNLLKTIFHTVKCCASKQFGQLPQNSTKTDIITKRFKERGYPEKLINEKIDKVKNMEMKHYCELIK